MCFHTGAKLIYIINGPGPARERLTGGMKAYAIVVIVVHILGVLRPQVENIRRTHILQHRRPYNIRFFTILCHDGINFSAHARQQV
jgi:hypothetical protein